MKFVGVREFKQDAVKYLNEGSEIVVMKRKKPIARLVPVREARALGRAAPPRRRSVARHRDDARHLADAGAAPRSGGASPRRKVQAPSGRKRGAGASRVPGGSRNATRS